MAAKHRLSIRFLAAGLLVAGILVPLARAQQDPTGGRRPRPGYHLIPPFAEEKLNLTDSQKKQIADLEKETKVKLARILSADQMKTLTEARPPRPGGGQGGPDGGNQGGPAGGGPGGGQPGAGPS